jgi:hypothetical protein
MNNSLIIKVESLKNMLVLQATGGNSDNGEYIDLRGELINISSISKKLPRFVLSCRNLGEFWGYIKPKFSTYSERREFLRSEFDSLLTFLESKPNIPSDHVITETVKSISSDYIHEIWQKALERRSPDPEGAITMARTLLESTCKHILDASSVIYDESVELPKLYKLTAKQLNLSPSQHTEELFKQILGGCQSVVEGLGAVRNKHSDAHGKGALAIKAAPRHAELAVNLSGAMATFLLQTFESRKKD